MSRLVLLQTDPATWIEELRQRWADYVDPALPLELHYIDPQPSNAGEEPFCLQLLLEQAGPQSPDRASILLEGRHPVHGFQQEAISVLTPCSREQLLWYAGIAEECSPHPDGPSCMLTLGLQPMVPGRAYPIRSATGVEFRISSPPRSAHALSLLQVSTSRVTGSAPNRCFGGS